MKPKYIFNISVYLEIENTIFFETANFNLKLWIFGVFIENVIQQAGFCQNIYRVLD